MTDKPKPNPSSFRLSEEAKRLLKLLADANKRDMTGQLEWLITQAAKKEGIK